MTKGRRALDERRNMFDFSISHDSDGICISISPDMTLMEQIDRRCGELRKYYGREITGVRIDINQDSQRVVISVRKHGDHEFVLNEYGLMEGWEPTEQRTVIPENLEEQGNRTLGEWLHDVETAYAATDDDVEGNELSQLADAISDAILDGAE